MAERFELQFVFALKDGENSVQELGVHIQSTIPAEYWNCESHSISSYKTPENALKLLLSVCAGEEKNPAVKLLIAFLVVLEALR